MNLAAIRERLFAPMDIAGLVVVRIAFGAIMFYEVLRYFHNGWIRAYWIETPINFTYPGFDWVKPMSPLNMYVLFAVLGVLAFCIMAGFCYRLSAGLFALGWTYVFLLEQSRYLNHFYLLCVLAGILCLLPAHAAFSVDARRFPKLRSDTVPAWTIWILRAQLTIVYFYGGLAKINADWLAGQPMQIWMSERTDFPLIGGLFTEMWMVYFMSYSGLLLDLFIAPALLWKPTRSVAFALITLFHVMNSQLFPIGIFPWFMIVATTIYFPTSWPRRVLAWLGWDSEASAERSWPLPTLTRQNLIVAALAVYFAIQILVPFRHFLYPGDASWSEEGHLFAWRMKLREKRGRIEFFIKDPADGTVLKHDPKEYVPAWQLRVMSFSPDMIHQYAFYLAEQMRAEGKPNVEVRVRCAQSLNGRRPQWLIDPEVDLAAQPRNWKPAPWILPLEEPLVRQTAEKGD